MPQAAGSCSLLVCHLQFKQLHTAVDRADKSSFDWGCESAFRKGMSPLTSTRELVLLSVIANELSTLEYVTLRK